MVKQGQRLKERGNLLTVTANKDCRSKIVKVFVTLWLFLTSSLCSLLLTAPNHRFKKKNTYLEIILQNLLLYEIFIFCYLFQIFRILKLQGPAYILDPSFFFPFSYWLGHNKLIHRIMDLILFILEFILYLIYFY